MQIAGSGARSGPIGQRHGCADLDPDPLQNVTDPQHWKIQNKFAGNNEKNGTRTLANKSKGYFTKRIQQNLTDCLTGSADPCL